MIHNIQALRAIAAIMVLLHHAVPHYEAMGGDFFPLIALGKMGFSGVDIFFVISGFVIALTTSDKSRDIKSAVNFFKNRAARIYLGYWPFLFLIYTLHLKYMPGILRGADFFSSVFLYLPWTNYVLPTAWTLTFELYFYALFIPLFWMPKKRLPKAMLVIFLLLLCRTFVVEVNERSAIGFLTSHFLLEFFAGTLLYHYYSFLIKRWLIPVPVLMIVIGIFVGQYFEFKGGSSRVYSFGVAAVGLLWLFLILEKENIYQAAKHWTDLGDASYTIYLSHSVLLSMFYLSGLRGWITTLPQVFVITGFIAVILFIVLFSVQFYNTIESPLYHKIRKLTL